eukprot:3633451-Rhodomonas_salina.2
MRTILHATDSVIFNSLTEACYCIEPELLRKASYLADKSLPSASSRGVVARTVPCYYLED